MREFVCILTSLIFAGHAALGCCAHHAHAAPRGSAAVHGICSGDQHDHAADAQNEAPIDSEEHSGGGCDDASCVFVKSDVAQIHDAGNDALCLPTGAALAAATPPGLAATCFSNTASARARSTELYVWHCALLI